MSDWSNDPETVEWLRRFVADVLPNMRDSAVTMALWHGEIDPKQALELGYMIALDKPIILIVEQGCHVPEKLQRVADIYMEFDPAEGPASIADQIKSGLAAMKEDLDANPTQG